MDANLEFKKLQLTPQDSFTILVSPPLRTSENYFAILVLNSELILSAVQQTENSRQTQLREQLKKLRQELQHRRQTARNPLHLFPEEIWVKIFMNLNNLSDSINAALSHTLLCSITSSPQELLFFKVLPHLVLFFGTHPAYTVVTCGKVCKKWQFAVNLFIDIFYGVETPPLDQLQMITQEPIPNFSNKHMLDTADTLWKWNMRPFLSEVYLHQDREYDDFVGSQSARDCFWKVSWELDASQPYRSSECYAKSVNAIAKCKTLRSFRILDPSKSSRRSKIRDNGVNQKLKFKATPSLESLEILVRNSSILVVQDALLPQLSKQLKRLELYHWNSGMYHTLPWSNLTELEIVGEVSLDLLISLQQIPASKLYKLHIHWNTDLNFDKLFKVINQFHSLRHLSVLLTKSVPDKSLNVPLEIITVNQLTTLEIYSMDLNEGINILVLFPLVQNVVYHYGQNAAKYQEFGSGYTTSSRTQTETKTNAYIQLHNNMYHSNVWTMMPKLNSLILSCETIDGFNNRKFTRLGYIIALGAQAKLDLEVAEGGAKMEI